MSGPQVPRTGGVVLARGTTREELEKILNEDPFYSRTQRGKGYATQVSHALTRLAFEVLQAKKVMIYCDEENPTLFESASKIRIFA